MNSKRASEVRTLFVDFTRKLSQWEALVDTPTVIEIGTSDLTISGERVLCITNWFFRNRFLGSWVQFLPLWQRYEWERIDRAVEFSVAGGVPGRQYTIRVTVVTSASPQQTLIDDLVLRVN